MRVKPLKHQLRVLAKVVITFKAERGACDPEQLLVQGGNVVVDGLYIGSLGQGILVDLHNECWHRDGLGMVDRGQFINVKPRQLMNRASNISTPFSIPAFSEARSINGLADTG